MRHDAKYLSPGFNLLLSLVLLFFFSNIGGQTYAWTAHSEGKSQQVSENQCPFPTVPTGKFYKHKPSKPVIYQFDEMPLGNRSPLLIVHGLRAEYYPFFRWAKLVKHLNSNKEFAGKFKIYLARYNSLDLLDKTVPQMQEEIAQLYQSAGKKQIYVLALSIGGNLVYESMLKPETDSQIKLLMAMGSPFHGSPLFCSDWLQYGIYKNLSFPWTRIDHSIAYRLYFRRNSALLKDFRWDNCDGAIPNIGHFASKLPFGPKGNLNPAASVNDRMVAINKRNFDKNKLITYSGYLLNPYQLPEAARFIESTFLFPYSLVTTGLPAYLAREHAVLNMLNRVIGTVVTTEWTAKRSKTSFVYALNDGITPVISSMFIADRNCTQEGLAREADLMKLKPLVDVHTARIFRNIDHLTYISGRRPGVLPFAMRDELNADAGTREIFDWILFDLDCVVADDHVAQSSDT